jgi:hypothetical protein
MLATSGMRDAVRMDELTDAVVLEAGDWDSRYVGVRAKACSRRPRRK